MLFLILFFLHVLIDRSFIRTTDNSLIDLHSTNSICCFSFLDVRPLESHMNKNATPNEYHLFLDHMFYMYTKIAQYLRFILESNVEIITEIFNDENLIQLISLLAYLPEHDYDQSENFWQTKVNIAHLVIHILLQPFSSLHQLTNNAIVQHASELCSKLISFLLVSIFFHK